MYKFLFIFNILLSIINAFQDFTLVCRPGYKLVGLARLNSAYQRGIAGSFKAECQQIIKTNLEQVCFF